jgi:hypothetical protein
VLDLDVAGAAHRAGGPTSWPSAPAA